MPRAGHHDADLLDHATLGEVGLINALAAATTLVLSWGSTAMKNFVYASDRCTDIYVYHTADFAYQVNQASAGPTTFRNATFHYVAAESFLAPARAAPPPGPGRT